jgi:hypothetical protein
MNVGTRLSAGRLAISAAKAGSTRSRPARDDVAPRIVRLEERVDRGVAAVCRDASRAESNVARGRALGLADLRRLQGNVGASQLRTTPWTSMRPFTGISTREPHRRRLLLPGRPPRRSLPHSIIDPGKPRAHRIVSRF